MACYLAVFSLSRPVSTQEINELYEFVTGSDEPLTHPLLLPSPKIKNLYDELIAKYPEDIDEDVDDEDLVWSVNALGLEDSCLFPVCVWTKADKVYNEILRLAKKHDLIVYDPQEYTHIMPSDINKDMFRSEEDENERFNYYYDRGLINEVLLYESIIPPSTKFTFMFLFRRIGSVLFVLYFFAYVLNYLGLFPFSRMLEFVTTVLNTK